VEEIGNNKYNEIYDVMNDDDVDDNAMEMRFVKAPKKEGRDGKGGGEMGNGKEGKEEG
jgi:hypothetical protein